MYINFSILEKENVPWGHLKTLLRIKQGEVTEEEYASCSEWVGTTPFLVHIKGKKKDPPHTKARISEEGRKFLDRLAEPPVEPEDEVVFKWLSDYYKKLGKEVGNGARTKRHIRDFRVKSGIDKNKLIILCKTFISDEKNMDRSRVLEYVFYYPKNAFSPKLNLEDSWLYRYYVQHEAHFEKKFRELEKEEDGTA